MKLYKNIHFERFLSLNCYTGEAQSFVHSHHPKQAAIITTSCCAAKHCSDPQKLIIKSTVDPETYKDTTTISLNLGEMCKMDA